MSKFKGEEVVAANSTIYEIPILLVEDNIDLIVAFDLFLKDEGYNNVKACSDSKCALKYVIEDIKRYKLVILDIRMPEINGIHLYQIFRILNPSIKTMFLTALDDISYVLTTAFPKVKKSDIMEKPIDRLKFIERVNYKIKRMQ